MTPLNTIIIKKNTCLKLKKIRIQVQLSRANKIQLIKTKISINFLTITNKTIAIIKYNKCLFIDFVFLLSLFVILWRFCSFNYFVFNLTIGWLGAFQMNKFAFDWLTVQIQTFYIFISIELNSAVLVSTVKNNCLCPWYCWKAAVHLLYIY